MARPPWCNEEMASPRTPGVGQRALRAARIGPSPGVPPSAVRLVVATLAALLASLALCVLAVHVAEAQFPATRHFSHFRAADYGSLVVAGVLLGSGTWAVLVHASAAARRVFLRLAAVAMLLLWVPDAVLFALGEPAAGVGTLMVMHLLVALATYQALVRIAPQRSAAEGGALPDEARGALGRVLLAGRLVRRVWSTMAAVVGLELVLGIAVIVAVPFRRPPAVLPARGIWVYAAHGAVGIALFLGAFGVLVLAAGAERIARIGAVMGALGVVVGAGGGVLATYQTTRLLGMGVMLVGVVVAGVGYLAPSLEAMGKAEAAKAAAARAVLAGTMRREWRADGQGEPSAADEPVSPNGHGAVPPG